MYVVYRKMQSRYIDNICHLSLITPICVDVAWHNYIALTLSWFQGWTSRMHPMFALIRSFFVLRFFLFMCIFTDFLRWTMVQVQSGFSHGKECRTCIEQPSQNWSRQEESGCFIEAQCCDFFPLLWMSKRLDPNPKQARVNDGICYDSLTGWMVLV